LIGQSSRSHAAYRRPSWMASSCVLESVTGRVTYGRSAGCATWRRRRGGHTQTRTPPQPCTDTHSHLPSHTYTYIRAHIRSLTLHSNELSRAGTICPRRWHVDGHINGAATWRILPKRCRRRLRCRCNGLFRWPYGLADQWVRLPASGFLLVFCNNAPFVSYGYETDRQTNKQTDERMDHSTANVLLP